jgi:membrane-associated phospholipid phosphatase
LQSCISFPLYHYFRSLTLSFKRRAVLITVLITIAIQHGSAQNPDVDLLKAINPMYPTWPYWVQTSASAYWVPAAVLLGSLGYGFIENDKQIQHNAYELAINIVISQAVTEALKITIDRERPADKYPTEIFVNGPVHGESFPSGHTSLAFATATTLSLDYKKWYIVVPAYLWAGSVAYSRMYLGKHYPSDVLGGIVIGIGSGYLSHWLTRKLFANTHAVTPVHN